MCKIHIGLLVMPKKTQFLESVNENKEKTGKSLHGYAIRTAVYLCTSSRTIYPSIIGYLLVHLTIRVANVVAHHEKLLTQ